MILASKLPKHIKQIPDFPRYYISDKGEVYSSYRVGYADREFDELRPMKISLDRDGYPKVALRQEFRIKIRNVHRLVLEAFVGKRPDGLVCRHIDCVKTNNSLLNLCWGTPLENANDDKRLERRMSRKKVEELSKSRATACKNLMSMGWTTGRIARLFDCPQSVIENSL